MQDVNGALPPPGLPVTHVRLLTKVARMYEGTREINTLIVGRDLTGENALG